MLYLFVLATLLINLGFGFAAASFVGLGPAINFDFSRLPFFRRRWDASATMAAVRILTLTALQEARWGQENIDAIRCST